MGKVGVVIKQGAIKGWGFYQLSSWCCLIWGVEVVDECTLASIRKRRKNENYDRERKGGAGDGEAAA